MSKIIYLRNGGETIIDDRFYDYLNQWRWSKDKNGYIYRHEHENEKTITIYMHREISEIIGLDLSGDIDHKDQNTFNNLMNNLRTATKSQNQMNRGSQSNNTSGYKGVSFDKRNNKWTAEITVNGKHIYLGNFFSIIQAAHCYNEGAIKYFGEFAVLNKI